jgi:hypothetical protein
MLGPCGMVVKEVRDPANLEWTLITCWCDVDNYKIFLLNLADLVEIGEFQRLQIDDQRVTQNKVLSYRMILISK